MNEHVFPGVAHRPGEADGLSVVLTAAQLAAVLEHETIEPGGTVTNRLLGGLRLIGCGAELLGAGALLAAPEPTMLTKAGGVALAAHGADQCATGAREVWTGRSGTSLANRGATALARSLGASPSVAETAGFVSEIAVPVAGTAFAGAVRAGAVRAGRISLLRHEAQAGSRVGGHTIARHVGWSEAQLRQRLLETASRRSAPPMISSFDDLATAERAITRGLQVNKARIAAWAQSGGAPLPLTVPLGREIGLGVERATQQAIRLRSVRIVLKKGSFNGMPHFILTAFPV